jgi:putative spermidine/putrescine transport system ATP-binding protein
VLVGALFAFITSFDEVVVAMFLSGTSAITLPKLMWDSITLDELSPIVTAVASLQIGMALAVFATAEVLRGRGTRLAWAWPGPEEGAGALPGTTLGPAGVRSSAGPEEARLSTESLRLVGLSKRFGSVVAVDDATFQVEPGELLTILGPSGSGKTTLLNLIAGFDTPTSGEVFLGARALTREPPNRRGVGMVFQNYALFPHMTVFANVAFPLRLRRIAEGDVRARVRAILSVVQLTGLAERYPRQLSGGQQQRVALARALVFRPPLLLMDEPFGALDTHLRSRMQTELRQLHQRLGVTVLFVTHDQEEAMILADRIAVIARGRLQQVGRAEELYEAPANEFVAGFVGESNLLRGTVVSATSGTLRVVTTGGTEFSVAGEASVGRAVTLLIRPESIRLVADQPPGPHGLPGVVEEARYLGGLRRYTIRLNPDETIVVRLPNRPATRQLSAGSRVRVEWEPPDLRVL